MKKHILTLSLFFCSILSFAHQSDVSTTMLVEQEDGSWVLQIRTALTAFEHEVHLHYGKDSYKTPEEFNALVLRHVMENVSIDFGEKGKAELTKGFVKLGHETNVVFQVLGVPENIENVTIVNSSFKNIHGNQNALIILKNNFEKNQFILKEENSYTAKLKVVNNAFQLKEAELKKK